MTPWEVVCCEAWWSQNYAPNYNHLYVTKYWCCMSNQSQNLTYCQDIKGCMLNESTEVGCTMYGIKLHIGVTSGITLAKSYIGLIN